MKIQFDSALLIFGLGLATFLAAIREMYWLSVLLGILFLSILIAVLLNPASQNKIHKTRKVLLRGITNLVHVSLLSVTYFLLMTPVGLALKLSRRPKRKNRMTNWRADKIEFDFKEPF